MVSSMTLANPAIAEVVLFLSGRAFIKSSQSFFKLQKGSPRPVETFLRFCLISKTQDFFRKRKKSRLGALVFCLYVF